MAILANALPQLNTDLKLRGVIGLYTGYCYLRKFLHMGIFNDDPILYVNVNEQLSGDISLGTKMTREKIAAMTFSDRVS